MTRSKRLIPRVLFSVLFLLCALCAGCGTNPALSGPTPVIPTALPTSLRTPIITATPPAPEIPVALHAIRAGWRIGVEPASEKIETISLPVGKAAYWEESAPLGSGKTTVILGFSTPTVFGALGNLRAGDMLVVTDQYNLRRSYTVTTVEKFGDYLEAFRYDSNRDLLLLIGFGMPGEPFVRVALRPV